MSEVRANTAAPSFFDLYSRGEVPPDDIDEYVGRWRAQYKNRPVYPPLHEYLGLTSAEYEVLLHDPFALPRILQARRPGEDLVAIMTRRYAQLCADNQPQDATIIVSLGNWLQRQPRR